MIYMYLYDTLIFLRWFNIMIKMEVKDIEKSYGIRVKHNPKSYLD